CNDGDACTVADTCQGGVCAGTPVVCHPSDQCHAAGTCNPATGTCSDPPQLDGTRCDDGNACTQTDTCEAGACVGGDPVVCTAAATTPPTGTSTNPPHPTRTRSDDGNACTPTDTCEAGACVGGNPVVCTAADQCHTAGVCNPASGGCSNPAKLDGAPCDDGNTCTQTDNFDTAPCVGGNHVVCTAADQCHTAGVCNPASGGCSNPAKLNGAPCDDGDACTRTDTCEAGACVGANPVVCTAADQCHTAGTCDPTTGACSNPAKL